MKPLPKEFQFKCDENSLKQCELLGIQLDDWDRNNMKYSSENYFLIKKSGIDYNYKPYNQDLYPIISLADYIEHNVEANETIDHSDLIVELTGKYVIGGYDVPHAIKLAEETVKQLKEKGYLK
jgi:hypothetical protein